jgi:hypothetical protein
MSEVNNNAPFLLIQKPQELIKLFEGLIDRKIREIGVQVHTATRQRNRWISLPFHQRSSEDFQCQSTDDKRLVKVRAVAFYQDQIPAVFYTQSGAGPATEMGDIR